MGWELKFGCGGIKEFAEERYIQLPEIQEERGGGAEIQRGENTAIGCIAIDLHKCSLVVIRDETEGAGFRIRDMN